VKLSRIFLSLFSLALVACALFVEPIHAFLGNFGSDAIVAAGAMPILTSQTGRLRGIYDQLLKQFQGLSSQLITMSYLRSELLVSNTNPIYKFNLLSENASPRATENRLDKNDVFIATHLGFYLVQNPITAVTGVEQLSGISQTYNNPTALNGSGSVPDLAAFWNGFWQMKVGSTVFFDAFPNQLTWMAPDTQQSNATTRSSRSFADGAAIIEPLPVFSGSGSNDVTLTIPIWAGFTGAASDQAVSKIYAVFNPFGFLIKNGANYIRS